jgi:hypothetical protein
MLDILSCPLREEDKGRPHNPTGNSGWLLRGLEGLLDLHSITTESGGEQRC